MNEVYFIGSTLLLLGVATAVLRWWMDFAQSLLTTLMLVIAVLSQAPLQAFGLNSNVGNILYGVVIYIVGVSTARQGLMKADVVVVKVFAALLFMHSLFLLYRANPGGLPDALLLTTQTATRTLVASFMAFVFSMATVIRLADLWKGRWWSTGAACFIAQVVDSFVFFPLAFGGTGVDVAEYLWGGLLFKWGVTLLAWPFGEWLLAQGEPEPQAVTA